MQKPFFLIYSGQSLITSPKFFWIHVKNSNSLPNSMVFVIVYSDNIDKIVNMFSDYFAF